MKSDDWPEKGIKKVLSGLLFLATMFVCLSFAFTVKATENQIVRIAYVESDNFMSGKSDEEYKSGYAYDYIRKIANYTGWSYDYVYVDWTEAYRMLENGEVDLMAGVTKTEERLEKISYPDSSMGTENIYVYVPLGSTITSEARLSGKKIGVISGMEIVDNLKTWISSHEYSCELVNYDGYQSLYQALELGEIDAVLDTDNVVSSPTNLVSVAHVGSEEIYLAVAKERRELLLDLNLALYKIEEQNPYYLSQLQQKYLSEKITSVKLTREERAWLTNHPQVKVGYLEGYEPFTVTKDGEAYGAFIDILEDIWRNLEITSELEYHAYADYDQMLQDLSSGIIDLATPIYADYWYAEQNHILLSNTICEYVLNMVYVDEYTLEESDYIAIAKNSPIQEEYVAQHYPRNPRLLCSNLEACMKAVKRGSAQATIVNTYKANVLMANNTNFRSVKVSADAAISMATEQGNNALLSIVNSGLARISRNEVDDLLTQHADEAYHANMENFFSTYWPAVVTVLACVLLIIIVIVGSFSYSMTKKEKQIVLSQRELNLQRSISNTDELTGLLNRRAYEEELRNIERDGLTHDTIVFSVDINGLKQVNDELGHVAGDELIIGAAGVLNDVLGSLGNVYRIGGDEFVAILQTSRSGEDIKGQLSASYKRWRGQLVEKLHLSSGFAEAREFPDVNIRKLFNIADGQMYRSKEMYYRRTGKDRRR